MLQGLLKTTDRVVQEIDSVEYGLTDIQEYYANTGALQKAAENARGQISPTLLTYPLIVNSAKCSPLSLKFADSNLRGNIF